MGVIWTPPKTLTRQPQGRARLQDDLLRDAVFAFHGHYNTVYSDQRSGKNADLAVTAFPANRSKNGIGFDNRSTEGAIEWEDSSGDSYRVTIPSGSGFTFTCLIDDFGATGTNPGFWRSGVTFIPGAGDTFFIQNGSSRKPWVRLNGTDVLKAVSGPAWTDGKSYAIVVRFLPGQFVDVWWNGKQQHYTATAVSDAGLENGNAIRWIGAQANTSERTTGNWCGASFSEGAISDGWAEKISRNYWSMYQAPVNRTIFLPTAGGTTIAVNQATETSTAQSIAPSRRAAVAQAIETSTAQSIAPAKVVAVGQAVETSTAQSTTPSKTVAVQQATETSTAQSVAPVQPGAVVVEQATETDTAQPITPLKRVAVNTATETSTAQAMAAARRVAVGRALEISTAFAVTRVQDIIISVGQASETSTAFSIASQVGTPTPNLFAPRGILSVNRGG